RGDRQVACAADQLDRCNQSRCSGETGDRQVAPTRISDLTHPWLRAPGFAARSPQGAERRSKSFMSTLREGTLPLTASASSLRKAASPAKIILFFRLVRA